MLVKEVNLQNIVENFELAKSIVKVPTFAVIKADAYGHGAKEVASVLQDKAHAFCVATEGEARELVGDGIKKDILVLGRSVPKNDLSDNIVPTVSSVEEVEILKGRAKRIYIKVNTGMNRMGCSSNDFENILLKAKKSNIKVEGAFTHFFNASNEKITQNQYEQFLAVVGSNEDKLFLHACASNALTLPSKYYLDGVRMGLGMYGYGIPDLKPAMAVYATVIWTGKIKKGDHVGYGDTVAERDMCVATLSIGYADGISRNGKFNVSINGKKCPNVGFVCMDYTVVEVEENGCKVGDRAYLLGEGISMSEFCEKHNVISHEALTLVKGRAKTIYV